jgi:epoxyqueuosine reductase QueG
MPSTQQTTERRDWIIEEIQGFCQRSENTLRNEAEERAWGQPLVGFSRGHDPLFQAFRQYVGSYHWTPSEIFSLTFPHLTMEPEELTVICWVLPQTDRTKADNRAREVFPAERWARSRIYGEAFNSRLREHVVSALEDRGHKSVAPFLSPQWETKPSQDYVYASTWSERHAAYASGLGTFGLCDGLITRKGKAMRVGSVVAHIQIPATPREYNHHRQYCLFFTDGTCGECIPRCPVGAITEAGHNKERCGEHLSKTAEYVRTHYGFEGYGCGLCQTGVPCESTVPTQSLASHHRGGPAT